MYKVRKAMESHRKANPNCAYCGRSFNVQVHHIEPVSFAPHKAADPSNLITLCTKRCHITVGHMGNYKHYNANAKVMCDLSLKVKPQ